MGEGGVLKGIVDSDGVCNGSADASNRISI
jgi:hypothetical protein